MSLIFDGKTSPLTYGIEIEIEVDNDAVYCGYYPEEQQELEVSYTDPRTGCEETAYVSLWLPEIEGDEDGEMKDELDGEGWEVRSDGSLHSSRGGTMVEVVSPVLAGEDGIQSLREVADILERYDATHNRSCGMHVHVAHMNVPQAMIDQLDRVFHTYEMAFFGLGGDRIRQRIGGSYCKPKQIGRVERYVSLNLTNYPGYGKPTIEYRCFAPTTDADDMIAAVTLAVGFQSYVFSGAAAEDVIPERYENPLDAIKVLVPLIDKSGYLPGLTKEEREGVFQHMYSKGYDAMRAMGFSSERLAA